MKLNVYTILPLSVLGCDVCRGFVAYLKGAPNYNLEMYKALVGQITTTFNNISKDILSIEKTFKDADMADISRTIRKIQDIEQQKLQTVCIINQPLKDLLRYKINHTYIQNCMYNLSTIDIINGVEICSDLLYMTRF